MFVGHTRFSLYQPGSTAWHASNKTRLSTPVDYRNYLFSPERLEPRMDIFLTMTLPQLDLAARGHNLRHVVSFSTYLPGKYRKQLEAAAEQYPWLVLDPCAVGEFPTDPLELAGVGMVGAYRLDDDDILPADYFDRMSPFVTEAHAGMFASLASGITAIYRDGQLQFTRYSYVPMIAIGFLAIHEKRSDGTLVSPPPASHNLSDRAAPVILDSRAPGYIWVRHLEQDTNLHAANLPVEKRLQSLVKYLGERPPATDRAEFDRYFPVLADRMHAGVEPGETLQAPISQPVVIPPAGLPLELSPIRGNVSVQAKLRPNPAAVPRNALLAFELETTDGTPLGAERADELRAAGFSHSDRIGFYKYLRTEPGRFVTYIDLALPDEVVLTGVQVRRWHRLETPIRVDELVFTSRS